MMVIQLTFFNCCNNTVVAQQSNVLDSPTSGINHAAT